MGLAKTHHLTILSLAILSLASSFATLPDEFSILDKTQDLDGPLLEERANELFQRWKEKHGKAYRDSLEEEERFRKFKDNLRYVMERNRRTKRSGKGHVVGLNRFADMSNEEFREVYLSKVNKPVNKKWGEGEPLNRSRKVESCESPSSLDWRDHGIVTSVKNQGQCGSCWAFSSTGAMEGINALVTGNLISLSEQELVACDTTNYGCNGGDMDYAFAWVVSNGGINSEANYPYTSGNGVSGTCNTTKEEQKVVSINGYVDVGETDSALLCAVVKQPISVGMDGSAIDFQLYTGGIYDGSCSSNPNNIDHAVLIVGYGSKNGVDYWICKNSWGKSWGIVGYFYIERNTSLQYGVCAINAMASYPTKQSSPSPTTPPPPSPPSPPPSPHPPPPPPTPPPPPPTPPPPPPPPPASDCGDYSYCPTEETCCCLYEYYDFCLSYGCCAYENAVCCTGTDYCCPSDYPICDVQEGLCLQSTGDKLGLAAKKRKLPWTKLWNEKDTKHRPLQWKRSRSSVIR